MVVHGDSSVEREDDASTDHEHTDDATATEPTSRTETTATDRRTPPAEAADSRGFLSNVEFLTGPDPNLGSFLLVVGMVSIVFIALFQLTLPTTVAYLLTAGVLFVTVISALFAFLLDAFGYFEGADAQVDDQQQWTNTDAKPWVPATKTAKPLPPLLNFDSQLRAYSDMFDGTLPRAFDPFLEDYRRLKTNTRNRTSIASDLRADLNPIGTLFESGTEGDRIYEDLSERLFRYIDADSELASVERMTFHTEDGTETDVASLAGGLGRVELVVSNEGEPVDVTVVVEFRDATGAVLASRTCDAGRLSPGARRTVDADVYVPGDTVGVTKRLEAIDVEDRNSDRDRRVLRP